MKVTVNKENEANFLVSGTIEASAIEENVNKLAVKAGKEMKVDGFRKGKVPPHVVKQLHGEKLQQDAEGEVLQTLIDTGIKEAGIEVANLIGQPSFKKYDKTDSGIEVEMEISTRPTFDSAGYKDAMPKFDKPEVTQEQIDEKLNELAAQQSPLQKIARKRMVRDGDNALIDFEGFIDGEAFEGGKAEKFVLKIGSGQFIPGFEEQIIGMKYEEEKTVEVTFPQEYNAANLAGKNAEFKVKLHEIQEQVACEIDDEFAKKVMQGDENATVATLTENVTKQLQSTEISKIYHDELKPKIKEALVAKFDFDLPNNIVDQEVDAQVNAKAQGMSQEELDSYKDNPEKVDELRAEVRDDATASVKATFIVDELAKLENITVSDQEVSQALYYEAMMGGQDPQQTIKYYEDNNLLPAVKMSMIEDKLFAQLLGLDD